MELPGYSINPCFVDEDDVLFGICPVILISQNEQPQLLRENI
jgi:hypothetical protein